MSQDDGLFDAIKANFVRKSSAQLQEIVASQNRDRWSPEAIAAAGELLRRRLAGCAQEPQVAEEEVPPPAIHYEPNEIALGVLAGLLTGYLVIPYYRVNPYYNPDLPVPFGSRTAWRTLETTDTEAVAIALDLSEPRSATWAEGVEAAISSRSSSRRRWATGPSRSAPRCSHPILRQRSSNLLKRLSKPFGNAQYFATHRECTVELHIGGVPARAGSSAAMAGWVRRA